LQYSSQTGIEVREINEANCASLDPKIQAHDDFEDVFFLNDRAESTSRHEKGLGLNSKAEAVSHRSIETVCNAGTTEEVENTGSTKSITYKEQATEDNEDLSNSEVSSPRNEVKVHHVE
jgi:hypothetical protein